MQFALFIWSSMRCKLTKDASILAVHYCFLFQLFWVLLPTKHLTHKHTPSTCNDRENATVLLFLKVMLFSLVNKRAKCDCNLKIISAA